MEAEVQGRSTDNQPNGFKDCVENQKLERKFDPWGTSGD
jgi:hypothetical protein